MAEVRRSIKERLAGGSSVQGVFWVVADASLAEFVAMLGWDFLIADLEHSAMSIADVEDCARACHARDVELLVRLPLDAGGDISKALDAGASGVVVPYVESVAEARKAVDLVKYPPIGRRGLAPMRGADFGLKEELGKHTVRSNRESLIVVQIESAKGRQALPEILGLKEVDVVFAGVLDLSMSLGLAGQTGHASVIEAVRSIGEQAVAVGKAFGAYGSDPETFQANRALGARMLAIALEDLIIRGCSGFPKAGNAK